jgi:hypothetical protein
MLKVTGAAWQRLIAMKETAGTDIMRYNEMTYYHSLLCNAKWRHGRALLAKRKLKKTVSQTRRNF